MRTKIVLFVSVLLLSISSVSAQRKANNVSPEDRAKAQTEKLAEKMLLLDDQKEKLYQINLKYIKEGSIDRSSDSSKRDKEIKALLSEQQQKEYDKVKEEIKEERQNSQSQGKGGKGKGRRGRM